jgi:serpin B
MKATEESRQIINQWVADQTEDKIKDLIPQGTLDENTRLVLTNAIYFNAAWANPFHEESTVDGQFHLLNGGESSARLMQQSESFGYYQGDNFQAVELPYDGNELSMVIILPDLDQFTAFESGINSQQVDDIVSNLKRQQVNLSMPKFKIESKFSLKTELSNMGMPDAFYNADFSGMDGKRDLEIGDVVHKAFVSVDEAGTEAAAATGVVMQLTSVPLDPVKVTVDHPYIFFIRDIKTGAVLFIGRVMDPAE